MVRRTQEAYNVVFGAVSELAPGFEPSRIHCDFERALMNGLRVTFPLADIVGCLWHYAVVSICPVTSRVH